MGIAHAQQSRKVYRIAIVHPSTPAADLTQASRGSIATGAGNSVASRPGGNITGVFVGLGDEQMGKRLQLLKQMMPQAYRLAILEPREIPNQNNAAQLEFSRMTGLTRVGSPFNRPMDETKYRRLVAALVPEGAEEIFVSDAPENVTNLGLIIELAEKGRLPAMDPYREFVEAGARMSCGADLRELGARAANMAGQILKGARADEIAVFLPTKFSLTINLRTAKALGLTVPRELLATADEVIK